MLITSSHRRYRQNSRRAFTLVELLIAITILAMLSALSMSMLRNIAEYSRIDRTKVIIARLDTLIMERYNAYASRTVPLRLPPGTNPNQAMYVRLVALRELMRMELPDRIDDLANGPFQITTGVQVPQPSAWKAMRRRADNNWLMKSKPEHSVHQSAECLYLIISSINQGDRSAIDAFSASEIGDVDGDGMLEILDAWGQPIQFLRWAPGYTQENGVTTLQTSDASVAPDPFDPLKIDPTWQDSTLPQPFALKPLIFSAGQDRLYDINTGGINYAQVVGYNMKSYGPSYPYFFDATDLTKPLIGKPLDSDSDGSLSFSDNITNHYVETP